MAGDSSSRQVCLLCFTHLTSDSEREVSKRGESKIHVGVRDDPTSTGNELHPMAIEIVALAEPCTHSIRSDGDYRVEGHTRVYQTGYIVTADIKVSDIARLLITCGTTKMIT